MGKNLNLIKPSVIIKWPCLRIVLLFFTLSGIPAVYSQVETRLDSLERDLGMHEDLESKNRNLVLLSEGYLYLDQDRADEYAEQLLELSLETNFFQGIADAYSLKGMIYRVRYSYDTALLLSKKALRIADSIGDMARSARINKEIGHTLFRYKGPKEGLVHYMTSFELYSNLADSLGISETLNGIGVMYMRMSVYDSAVSYFLRLLPICESLGFEETLGKGYVNLGVSYIEMLEYDLSAHYLEKSLPISEKYGNDRFISIAYNNLGSIAFDYGNLDEALDWYTRALEMDEMTGNLLGVANLTVNIGNVYEARQEYDIAFDYYSGAKEIYTEIGDWNGFLITYKNMGFIYGRWGEYDRALEIYDSCISIGKEQSNLIMQKETLNNIFVTYVQKNDYYNAYHSLEEYYLIKDSIFNIEKEARIATLQLKYEKEKDQAEILKLSNENLDKDLSLRKRTIQRNIYLYSGMGLIFLVLFLFLFFRQKALKDKAVAEQRIQQLEEEKKMLAARTLVEGQENERKRLAKELHDGLGVLLSTVRMQFTTIRDTSPENIPLIDRAVDLLEQASGDVRKISHNMMPGLLTRLGFFEAVEDLLDKVRETDNFEIISEIPEDTQRLPENTEIMLYRIVQEVINNTLKHAQARKITLKIRMLQGNLEIHYSDDGKGFNVEEKMALKTIGLQSIQSRINFLKGTIDLKSEADKGAHYQFAIPL